MLPIAHHVLKKELYLAGGCFWGVQAYFDSLKGVLETTVGYANGHIENPTYEDVCHKETGFAEALHIVYDEAILHTEEVLYHFFAIIDPYSLNKQGNDVGTQYRTGIYYVDEEDKELIQAFISKLEGHQDFVVEIAPLENFYRGEDYHQKYLEKHPDGYCHIDIKKAQESIIRDKKYVLEQEEALKERIGEEAFQVTQELGTEKPFTGTYDNHFEKGIYVDIVSGKPLFLSTDKFQSGCGWPAFTRPITEDMIHYLGDDSIVGRPRIEVRSDTSHLGHVFNDGPEEDGGLRYCINSAALHFVPYEDMEAQGYGYLKPLVR